MANFYALVLGLTASATLMGAYGDPSSNAMNQGSNPSFNNTRTNNTMQPQDSRLNANNPSANGNQTTYVQKPVNSDTLIIGQIQDRIKGAYKQYRIDVTVVNGIATLTGSVNSQLDKDAIERDVKNVPGITKVNNQLTIQR